MSPFKEMSRNTNQAEDLVFTIFSNSGKDSSSCAKRLLCELKQVVKNGHKDEGNRENISRIMQRYSTGINIMDINTITCNNPYSAIIFAQSP